MKPQKNDYNNQSKSFRYKNNKSKTQNNNNTKNKNKTKNVKNKSQVPNRRKYPSQNYYYIQTHIQITTIIKMTTTIIPIPITAAFKNINIPHLFIQIPIHPNPIILF